MSMPNDVTVPCSAQVVVRQGSVVKRSWTGLATGSFVVGVFVNASLETERTTEGPGEAAIGTVDSFTDTDNLVVDVILPAEVSVGTFVQAPQALGAHKDPDSATQVTPDLGFNDVEVGVRLVWVFLDQVFANDNAIVLGSGGIESVNGVWFTL